MARRCIYFPKQTPAPDEYIKFKLMQLYHCTPLEYDEQPASVIELHCEFLRIEREKIKLDAKRSEFKSKSR